ncbi:hypothetical protein IGI39_004459 [Enterococcus sp. AZ135]
MSSIELLLIYKYKDINGKFEEDLLYNVTNILEKKNVLSGTQKLEVNIGYEKYEYNLSEIKHYKILRR